MEFFDSNAIDLDLDLNEISFDNPTNDLPTTDDNYKDFSFDMSGGAMSNNNNNNNNFEETKLPGEELLEEPEVEKATSDGNQNAPVAEKIQIELVDDKADKTTNPVNNSSLQLPSAASQEEGIASPPSQLPSQLPDREVQNMKPNNPNNNSTQITTFNLDNDNNNEQLDSDEIEELPTLNEGLAVSLAVNNDETAGPVIVESEEQLKKLDVDDKTAFLDKLREQLNSQVLESEIVENEDDILDINKMLTTEYSRYITLLHEFYSNKKKKQSGYSFNTDNEGKLVKTNLETGTTTKITLPKYINVKDQIKLNNQTFNNLLYDISVLRKNLLLDEKRKFFKKNSENFDVKIKEITEIMKENTNMKLYLDFINNTEKLKKTNASILKMKTKQVSLFSNIKETFKSDSSTKNEKYDLILEYLGTNSKIIQACKKTRTYLDINESDYIITTEKPQLPKVSKGTDVIAEVKELQDEYDKKRAKIIEEEKAYYKTIQSPPLSWKATSSKENEDEDNEANEDNEDEDEDNEVNEDNEYDLEPTPKTKVTQVVKTDKEKTSIDVSEPQKEELEEITEVDEEAELEEVELGDATAPKIQSSLFGNSTDDENGEDSKKSIEQDALDALDLNLDDDIEAYAPNFDEGEGYPDETDNEDEDETVVTGTKSRYKYNISDDMTPEKKQELALDKKNDQQIPLQMISPEKFNGKKSKKVPLSKPLTKPLTKPQSLPTKGRSPSPELNDNEIKKIYRQLNKPVDENIKVIDIDTNLSFTKNDSSKSKSKRKRRVK